MNSKRITLIVLKIALVVALVAGISGGCGGGPAEVTVERLGPRVIEETVMVAGSLESSSPTQVIPQVYGTVSQVYAQDGQEVAAGEPLVQLDTSDLEQSLLSAQASLESVQGMASMFNSISASASNLGASVNSVLASVDSGVDGLYEIMKSLIAVVPPEYRFDALNNIDTWYTQYVARRECAPVMSTSVGGMSTGAQQAAASKAIDNAQKDLAAATIVAPVSGTLISSQAGGLSIESMMGSLMSSFSGLMPAGLDLSALTGLSGAMGGMGYPTPGALVPGSYVMPGSPIYTIVDLKSMSLVATVDETDIVKVQEGQKATVYLESYPDETFSGKIMKVADSATTNEAGATAFEVSIQMDPVAMNLKLGMTGTSDVVVASKIDAVTVPIEAIVEKDSKQYIYKVVDGKAQLTEVTLGIATESDVEIIDGAEIGDKVVTKGVEKLKDGQAVKSD